MFKLIRKIAASIQGVLRIDLSNPRRPALQPEDMTNGELLAVIGSPRENSHLLFELMAEANRRGLGASVDFARRYVDDHWNTWLQDQCLYSIRTWGNKDDVALLRSVARETNDYIVLAGALKAIISLEPAQYRNALAEATTFRGLEYYSEADRSYVIGSAIESIADNVPDSDSGLEELLLEWTARTTILPASRSAIFRRLARMPRTARIEQFFIDYYLANDLSYPELMQIKNDALRSTPANNATA